MKIAKILQLAGRKLTWTHRQSKHAEKQLVLLSGKQQRYLKTEDVQLHEHTQHLRKLGQAEPLTDALPDFCLGLAQKAALHSAELGQLFHLHTHPHKHVLAHIDCSEPGEHMHAETPTQRSYEPSHLMFMHQPQSRLSKPPCGFI